jgi:hypothetical protein
MCYRNYSVYLLETPKYFPFFFRKRENPVGLFYLNIADLDFYNTSCITLCAITYGPGRLRRPVCGALMQRTGPGAKPPRVGVANRRRPYSEMSRIFIFQWFYLSCYIYSIWLVLESPKYFPLFFGKRENFV